MSFSTTTPPTPAELEAAKQLNVFDAKGNEVPLASLFEHGEDGKAIVIFIRHFFCGFCQDYISYLTTHISASALSTSNVKLSIVGCGDWKLAGPYKETLGTPFEVYADLSKKSYEALGMTLRSLEAGKEKPEYQKSGFMSNVMGSIMSAFKMKTVASSGDMKQLGGEFVFRQGQPVYTHRMENTRGHAPLNEVLAAAGLPAQRA
ncbi:hypothetical protein JCM11641_006172 [Rhodosporidiobolus odoratus]